MNVEINDVLIFQLSVFFCVSSPFGTVKLFRFSTLRMVFGSKLR